MVCTQKKSKLGQDVHNGKLVAQFHKFAWTMSDEHTLYITYMLYVYLYITYML